MQSLAENGLKEGGTGRACLANEDVIAAALANRMRALMLPPPALQQGLHPPPPHHFLQQQRAKKHLLRLVGGISCPLPLPQGRMKKELA